MSYTPRYSTQPRRSRKPVFLGAAITVAVIALVVGGYFLISAALDPYDCRILENVSIAGLDVGGMTRSEARKALETAAQETLSSLDLTVTLPEDTLTFSPADIQPKLNIRKAVSAAYSYGRTGSEEEQQAALEASQNTTYNVGILPFLSFNEAFIQNELAAYAQTYDTELAEHHYELEGPMPELQSERYDPEAPCQVLQLTLGIPRAHLDTQTVFKQITDVYDHAFAAAQTGGYLVQAEMIPDELPQTPDLAAIYEELAIAPVDDTLDMESYVLIPGSYGYDFDMETAETAVAAAAWGETVSIPMVCTEPEILGDGVYFRDVLGTCETKHTDDENRNNNLRLVCEALDGLILQPGDEFSYNGVVGERTPERGYLPAGAYSGDRLVRDYGGGVCQGSTTLYNCVMLADLEVLERVCHGFTVNYVPIGLDAAVNWATKTDFKFRNSANFPIKIQAEVSDGYMRMKILGTDEKDYYIELRSSRSDEELRIYSNSYKFKYDKETGELISKDLEARSSYMYYYG